MFAAQKQELSALEARVRASAQALSADIAALRGRLAGLEAEALKPLATAEDSLRRAAGATAKQLSALRAQARELAGSGGAGVGAAATARVEATEADAKAAWGAVAKQLSELKATQRTAVQRSREIEETALVDLERSLAGLQAALVPITQMNARLTETEAQVTSLVAEGKKLLDGIEQQAVGRIRQLMDQIHSVIDTGASLESIQQVVDGLPEMVLPAIRALKSLISGLQTAFKTGSQALSTALNTAKAAVDALPVSSLPKPLVAPTQKGIESALNSAVAAIDSAAKSAGAQLASLSVQVQTQIDSTKSQGLAQVDAFVTSISNQIGAVLPAAEAQLATIQAAIDSTISQVGAQTAAANTNVLLQVSTLKKQQAVAVSELVASRTRELDATMKIAQSAIAERQVSVTALARTLSAQGAAAAATLDVSGKAVSKTTGDAIRDVAQSLKRT